MVVVVSTEKILKNEKHKKDQSYFYMWNEKLSSFQIIFEHSKKNRLFWVMPLGEQPFMNVAMALPLLWGDAFVDLGGFKFPISALQYTTASKTRWPKRTDVYQMNQRDLLFIPKRWEVTYITFP